MSPRGRHPVARPGAAAILGLALSLAAGPGAAIDVPSGQDVSLHEVLLDTVEQEQWLRFRFIAPGIGDGTGGVGFEQAGPDMDYLCATLALDYMREEGLNADIVVISLADRAVEFGANDPDATQFFEAYRVRDGACIWEAF